MKIKTWTVGFAVLTLVTAPAFAETGLGQRSYDQNIVPVGCESCDTGCCDDDCCGDPCCGDPCCGDGVAATGLLSGMGPGIVEGFSLAGALGIDALDIGGWSEFGWTDDVIPLSTTPGDELSFRDTPDNLDLNQQWFYIGKAADGSNGLGLGFRADIMYGTDAHTAQSFGNPPGVVTGGPGDGTFDNNTRWDHGVYGWAIPQLYGEVAVGDFSVKVGHFFTVAGYEVVPATGNFFYSHALTHFNSEPFTHTGLLSAYTGFEGITLYNGWTLGWDTGFDSINSGSSYIGGIGLSLSDAITFTYINTYGNFGDRDLGGDDSYYHSLLLTVGVTDKLQYVAESDYLRTDNTDEDDLSIVNYLFYGVNDWLKAGTRIEWWKNEGVSNYEFTSGVNISLLGNLIVRPEYRSDWVPATDFSVENVACDMILTY